MVYRNFAKLYICRRDARWQGSYHRAARIDVQMGRPARPGPSPERPGKLVSGHARPRAEPAAQAQAHELFFVSGGPVGPGKSVGLGRPITRFSEERRRGRPRRPPPLVNGQGGVGSTARTRYREEGEKGRSVRGGVEEDGERRWRERDEGRPRTGHWAGRRRIRPRLRGAAIHVGGGEWKQCRHAEWRRWDWGVSPVGAGQRAAAGSVPPCRIRKKG
jgi:hypothetical protein